jgi:hypothetical protein
MKRSCIARPTLLALLPLALGTTAGAMPPTDPPCIPEGSSAEFDFERPNLTSAGFPANASWLDGTGAPTAYDEDWLHDDEVGPGTPNADGSIASVTITNSGGSLFGPNGADLGFSGCIELSMEWTYEFVVEITECQFNGNFSQVGSGGSSSGTMICRSYPKRITRTVREGPVEVCPC